VTARAAEKLERPPARDPESIRLPQNIEAERATLGAALMQTIAADYVVDHLVPDDYYRHAHQVLFRAMRSLRQRDASVDMVTLKEELSRPVVLGRRKADTATRTELEDIGGPQYIAGLLDGMPASSNVAHYCAILKDLHAKRALYVFADLTCNYVVDGSHSSEDLLKDTDRRLMDLQAGHLSGRVQSLKETAPALFEALEWRVAHRGELLGLDTGYPVVNDLTSGWQAGDLTVIGARPSIGKTTFLLNTATACARALLEAKREGVVLLCSFEMRQSQLQYRFLSSLSGVPLSRIVGGHVMSNEWPALTEAINLMSQLPIEIDDRSGQTRWQIRSTCRRMKAEKGLAMVGIDYVQLIPGSLERRGASRNEEVTDISRGIKELADELSVPILLLSQLSRPGNKFGRDPVPKLTDLRESGALEQDADNVGFLHRRNHREGGPTRFILEKQRQGPTGTVFLTLDRDTVTFTNGGEEAPEPEPKERKDKPKKTVTI
jgi:replicative DNA helicase